MSKKCGRCEKTVYATEEMRAADKSWHKLCFKCATCKTKLADSTVLAHEGEIYCKNCVPKPGFTAVSSDAQREVLKKAPKAAAEGLGNIQKGQQVPKDEQPQAPVDEDDE